MPLSYQLKSKLENEDRINETCAFKSKFQGNCGASSGVIDGDLYRSFYLFNLTLMEYIYKEKVNMIFGPFKS